MESIGSVLQRSVRQIFIDTPEMRSEGIIDKIKEFAAEMGDCSIEAARYNLLVKPLWSEMKQNTAAAAGPGPGRVLLATCSH